MLFTGAVGCGYILSYLLMVPVVVAIRQGLWAATEEKF